MILKECKYCGKIFQTRNKLKIFCKVICQRRNYNQLPGMREKFRIWTREYRKNHPEWKERHRILAVTRHGEKRAKYWKEYGKRPEVRARINEKDRIRRKIDIQYVIIDRLRRSLNHALTKYSKKGKIMKSIKYGIDWKIVIEKLKPFPEKIENYEIDHIIPLCSFDMDDPEQIKKSFSPENLQWLTRTENRRKGGKIIR